jgi:hypothetical protein
MDGLIHDDAIDPAWMEDEAEGVNRADNPPIIIIIDHRAEPGVLLLTINQADYYYYSQRLQVN